MIELKLIVAGGRDFSDYPLLVREVTHIAEIVYCDKSVSIVGGGARGADQLGEQFAKSNNVQFYKFPADWNKHGKAAGFIRNKQMGDFANALLAFWDNKSRGTAHMIEYMRSLKKPVYIINY